MLAKYKDHKLLFISDLHLSESQPHTASCFVRFLSRVGPDTSALFILGDLFETWIGDDDNTNFNHHIQQQLRGLSQRGIDLFIMHGNRDFLIGKKFATNCGATLIDDPTLIQLGSLKVLLMHGDTLCTDDTEYQAFRRKVRKPWVKQLFLMIPLWLRRLIVSGLRNTSKRRVKHKSCEIMDVNQDAVVETFLSQGADILIHGHTHRPNIHEYTHPPSLLKRIVLGDWHEKGSVFIYDKGRLTLEDVL